MGTGTDQGIREGGKGKGGGGGGRVIKGAKPKYNVEPDIDWDNRSIINTSVFFYLCYE